MSEVDFKSIFGPGKVTTLAGQSISDICPTAASDSDLVPHDLFDSLAFLKEVVL